MLKPSVKQGKKFQNPVPTTVMGSSKALRVFALYFTNKEERVPRAALGPYYTNPAIYAEAPASGFRITWMGHSTMLIEIDGVRVLVDPVWDPRASPVAWAGPKRFFAPPLRLDQLPPLDAILISHDHYDHLGKQTVRQLATHPVASAAQWITSIGVGALLARFGVQPGRISELNWTQSVAVSSRSSSAAIKFTALPARHFSGRNVGNRFQTLWSSFAIKGPKHNIYFGADSGVWDGFAEIARQHGPFDLTMLDTGAYNELWKDIHMGPDGAAEVFAAMGATGLLMPIHWGLFDLALHAWRQPIERITELADHAGWKLWSPEPGLPTEVIAGQDHRSDWWRP